MQGQAVKGAAGAMEDARTFADETGKFARDTAGGIVGLGSKILGSVRRGAESIYSHLPFVGGASSKGPQAGEQTGPVAAETNVQEQADGEQKEETAPQQEEQQPQQEASDDQSEQAKEQSNKSESEAEAKAEADNKQN